MGRAETPTYVLCMMRNLNLLPLGLKGAARRIARNKKKLIFKIAIFAPSCSIFSRYRPFFFSDTFSY